MKEFKVRENIVIIVLALLVAGGLIYQAYQSWYPSSRGQFEITASSPGEDNGKEDRQDEEEYAGKDIEEDVAREIIVHVAGGVKNTGVYNLQEGSRVIDAVEAAGGFKEEAVSDAVNLAAGLQDGQQVYIPVEGEEHLPVKGAAGITDVTGIDSGHAQRININTASQGDLETLPGIGPTRAQAIIQERERGGPFQSVEDITRVSGIGDKTLESIRDLITI